MRRLSFLLAFVPFVTGQLPLSALAQSIGFNLEAAQSFMLRNGSQFQCGLVTSIDDYGPAKKAGVLLGDTVCGIDGHFYPRVDQIFDYLSGLPRGQEVTLRLSHPGGKGVINVKASLVSPSELSVAYRTYSDDDILLMEDRGGGLGNKMLGTTLKVADLDGSERYIYGNTNLTPIIGNDGRVFIDKGDTIYSINEQFFTGIKIFIAYTHSISPGTSVTVRFIKKADGKPYDVSIPMPARSAPPAVAATPDIRPSTPNASASTSNTDALVVSAIALGVVAVGCLIFCGSSKSNSENDHRSTAMDRYRAKGCSPATWQVYPYCGPPPVE